MMIGREYDYLKRIYNERLSRQGANQYTERASLSIDNEAQIKPTDMAAKTIGVGKATANKASQVVTVIDADDDTMRHTILCATS